jgi:hypothetical protein
VVAVDGNPVTAEEGLAARSGRGPAGSEVVLQVVSPASEPRDVTVQRSRLTAEDFVRGGALFPGMFYLLVPVVADGTLLDALVQLLETAGQEGQPVRGLILDLRIARSAAEWPLSDMLALLGDGQMGAFVDRQQQTPMNIPPGHRQFAEHPPRHFDWLIPAALRDVRRAAGPGAGAAGQPPTGNVLTRA